VHDKSSHNSSFDIRHSTFVIFSVLSVTSCSKFKVPIMNAPRNRRIRVLLVSLSPLLLVSRPSARADIYQWEYIDPSDPNQGKHQSTTLAPDGAGVDAVPGAYLSGRDLTMAYLIDADLSGAQLAPFAFIGFQTTVLFDADLSQANLMNANLSGANLRNASLRGANLQGASFSRWHFPRCVDWELSDSCYSLTDLTAADLSQADLTSANFNFAYLSGANLRRTNLTNVDFSYATLTGADFAGANVRNTNFNVAFEGGSGWPFGSGITPAQLYSTASYQAHDLSGIDFTNNDLAGANFAGQNLTNATFYAATLSDTDFTGARIQSADFGRRHYIFEPRLFVGTGITLAQLYSTASYQANDLSDVDFKYNDLAGGNFAGQNLINANFLGATLTGADFTGADVRGVSFAYGTGITLAQVYSTASYQAHDLSGIDLFGHILAGGNFAGQNLTNADFSYATLTGADLTAADARGAVLYQTDPITTNLIRRDGHISGLDLPAGATLVVRDYDGNPAAYPAIGPLPIAVDGHFDMGPGGTLRMVFEADAWDSTISFAPGIPVTLGGTLELTFAADVNLASQLGRTLRLFDWTGVTPSGAFAISSPYRWDLSKLYTTGEVTLTAVPEPLMSVLLSFALISLFQRRPNRATRHCHLFSRLYLLLMLLMIGVLPNSADAQVKVFILAGQSNAVGFAGNANNLPASLREPFEDVLFWYDIGMPNGRTADDIHVRPVEGTRTWVPLRPQVEFGGRVAFDKPNFGFTGQNITTGHGAELTLGRELDGRLSDQIAILKFAWNGTPLASTSGQQDWNVSSQGEARWSQKRRPH
jgi:uncharacterized protein YjbI with pentapeptide repeats